MSLLKSPLIKIKKTPVRLTLTQDIYDEIKAYCDWAGIKKIEEFIEEAAKFVFTKDNEWKKIKKEIKKHKK
ncbi:MAG: hypothetical protein LEGION0398_MBIBDBAK_01343 [Legionellaceae bacterium]